MTTRREGRVDVDRKYGPELFGSTYLRGEVVFRQGDPGDVMYIIQSGAVEVSQDKNGSENVIAILEKGDFFGKMALLETGGRSATITAISRTRLIPLTKALLVDRLKRDPDVSLHLLRKLIQRIQRAHRRYRQELLENEEFRNAVAAYSEKLLAGDRGFSPVEAPDALPGSRDLTNDLLLTNANISTESCRQSPAGWGTGNRQ
ncbi:cyclic nucleotide-binding domain-containing protein [uncultured Desulfosarcina sp.]|uniref:Crp/Fnr family transcriptional regulator n=1 Tax=uncultured Desulfosarcina sp. TaxID=218289 RepID=UPI0029C84A47|nr:cyclic nucleotide-binding domain-containing protein [uncultured Desulfosarcina sp.]